MQHGKSHGLVLDDAAGIHVGQRLTGQAVALPVCVFTTRSEPVQPFCQPGLEPGQSLAALKTCHVSSMQCGIKVNLDATNQRLETPYEAGVDGLQAFRMLGDVSSQEAQERLNLRIAAVGVHFVLGSHCSNWRCRQQGCNVLVSHHPQKN